jgi:hypothetical protein
VLFHLLVITAFAVKGGLNGRLQPEFILVVEADEPERLKTPGDGT